MQIQGQIVDIPNRKIYSGEITIENGKITSIIEVAHNVKTYILPGFVDAHIHIESSMLVPSEFAKIAVLHGTVGTISDPHEIANVLGKDGVHYMIDNGKKVPFKFHFGAPSCVPATFFETAGAVIDSEQIKELMDRVEKQCMEAGLKMTQHDSKKMKHQHGTTECGMYSLYCIIHLLEGKHTIDYFKKRRIPDKDVARYRKIYFNE